MFRKVPPIFNLARVPFDQKEQVQTFVDELIIDGEDNPYLLSFPLLISANLGDRNRYNICVSQLFDTLNMPEKKHDHYEDWMTTTHFKMWMYSRITLAAHVMQDEGALKKAQTKMYNMQTKLRLNSDSLAQITWAQCHCGEIKEKNYKAARENIHRNICELLRSCDKEPDNKVLIANTLWGLILTMTAASAKSYTDYHAFKSTIAKFKVGEKITDIIKTHLKDDSTNKNHFPLWAIAKLRLAAARQQDWTFYDELADNLSTNDKAEYALAVTEDTLAQAIEKQFRLKPRENKSEEIQIPERPERQLRMRRSGS